MSGLSPGRVWAFRVCGHDGRISFDVCASPQSFFTDPTTAQDSVQGGYEEELPGGRGSIGAASTASGAQADGLLEDADYPHLLFLGRVTCLAVHGNRAVIGAIGTVGDPTSGGPRGPASWKVAVLDDPVGDRWIRQSTGATPDCSTADLTGPTRAGVSAVVHDPTP